MSLFNRGRGAGGETLADVINREHNEQQNVDMINSVSFAIDICFVCTCSLGQQRHAFLSALQVATCLLNVIAATVEKMFFCLCQRFCNFDVDKQRGAMFGAMLREIACSHRTSDAHL